MVAPMNAGPPLPPAPAKKRSGCATAAIVVVVLVAASAVLGVVGILIYAVATRGVEAPAAGGAATTPPRAASAAPTVALPPPLPASADREVAAALAGGTCRRNDLERTKTSYLTATVGRGAAGALRGRVAIVHVKMAMTGAAWTPQGSRAVTVTAGAVRDYLLREGRRFRADLSIDAIEWPLATRFTMPQVRTDARGRVRTDDGENLRKTTRAAIEAAIGQPLQQLADGMRRGGYANVAFVVHFPGGPRGIRDFAVPVGSPGHAVELAYVLDPDWNATSRTMLVAHELLHLFGADDLYEVRNIAPDDVNDIMNAQCEGVGPTHVGEATAFSVGWLPKPPARSYAFGPR
jgi:hypothetical protein